MPLEYIRTDSNWRAGFLRVWYRDDYGQERFFELPARASTTDDEFGQALIREIDGFAPTRKGGLK